MESEAVNLSYDFELYTSRKLTLDPPQTSVGKYIRVDGPDVVEEEDEDQDQELDSGVDQAPNTA